MRMAVMIQIRNVPDHLHKALKARAAQAGMALSDYLRVELEQIVERPSVNEIRYRLASLPPAKVSEKPADAVRRERDRR
jgi:plasmid stability protein